MGTLCICQHPQRSQIRITTVVLDTANRPYRYSCRHICPLTQYGLQCGHKLSDDGLNAMTAPSRPEKQGKGKGERWKRNLRPLPRPEGRLGP